MNGFIATLSAAERGVWHACRRTGTWGTTGGNRSSALSSIAGGDLLFVWLSGGGLFAAAEILGPPTPIAEAGAPAPDFERFDTLLPIRVLAERSAPLRDGFDRSGASGGSRILGLDQWQVRGFAALNPEQRAACARAMRVEVPGARDVEHVLL